MQSVLSVDHEGVSPISVLPATYTSGNAGDTIIMAATLNTEKCHVLRECNFSPLKCWSLMAIWAVHHEHPRSTLVYWGVSQDHCIFMLVANAKNRGISSSVSSMNAVLCDDAPLQQSDMSELACQIANGARDYASNSQAAPVYPHLHTSDSAAPDPFQRQKYNTEMEISVFLDGGMDTDAFKDAIVNPGLCGIVDIEVARVFPLPICSLDTILRAIIPKRSVVDPHSLVKALKPLVDPRLYMQMRDFPPGAAAAFAGYAFPPNFTDTQRTKTLRIMHTTTPCIRSFVRNRAILVRDDDDSDDLFLYPVFSRALAKYCDALLSVDPASVLVNANTSLGSHDINDADVLWWLPAFNRSLDLSWKIRYSYACSLTKDVVGQIATMTGASIGTAATSDPVSGVLYSGRVDNKTPLRMYVHALASLLCTAVCCACEDAVRWAIAHISVGDAPPRLPDHSSIADLQFVAVSSCIADMCLELSQIATKTHGGMLSKVTILGVCKHAIRKFREEDFSVSSARARRAVYSILFREMPVDLMEALRDVPLRIDMQEHVPCDGTGTLTIPKSFLSRVGLGHAVFDAFNCMNARYIEKFGMVVHEARSLTGPSYITVNSQMCCYAPTACRKFIWALCHMNVEVPANTACGKDDYVNPGPEDVVSFNMSHSDLPLLEQHGSLVMRCMGMSAPLSLTCIPFDGALELIRAFPHVQVRVYMRLRDWCAISKAPFLEMRNPVIIHGGMAETTLIEALQRETAIDLALYWPCGMRIDCVYRRFMMHQIFPHDCLSGVFKRICWIVACVYGKLVWCRNAPLPDDDAHMSRKANPIYMAAMQHYDPFEASVEGRERIAVFDRDALLHMYSLCSPLC